MCWRPMPVWSPALPVPPASIAIDDSAAAIQADLSPGASALLAQRTLISGITVSDSGTITLTEAQATAAHVDDDANSVFARMPGAPARRHRRDGGADRDGRGSHVTPAHLAIVDDAAQIQADLTSGGSALLAHLATITGIVAGDGGVVSLSEAQVARGRSGRRRRRRYSESSPAARWR